MGKLSSDARLALLTEADTARAIGRLNNLLYEFTSPLDRFVTLVVAVLDPSRHLVTLVNAGHLSPMLYRPSSTILQEVVPKEVTGVPLGIMEGYTFDSCQLTLQPGESLLLFSDGILDSLNVRNEPFTLKGMQSTIQSLGAGTPRTLGERVIKAVERHATGRQPFDDVTLVTLGRIT
jgi:serine phosphatase RsbU (regulator of sigma subunit)